MNDRHFANTALTTFDVKGVPVTYLAGQVTRVHKGEDAFSDCLILGFSAPDQYGDVYVKLGRPYAYAICVGTISPSVLTGIEEFVMHANKLKHEQIVRHDTMIAGSQTREPYPSERIDLTELCPPLRRPLPSAVVAIKVMQGGPCDVCNEHIKKGTKAMWGQVNGEHKLFHTKCVPTPGE